jgi:hypothetical protein
MSSQGGSKNCRKRKPIFPETWLALNESLPFYRITHSYLFFFRREPTLSSVLIMLQ